MADKTISGLPLGAPLGTDEFAIQKTGGGINEKYTLDSIAVYGRALSEVHSNTDYVMSVTTTPVPLIGYDDSLLAVGLTSILTPAAGSNSAKFVIDKAGIYRVTFNIEVESSNNESIDFVIYVDGLATQFKTGVDLSTSSTDRGSAGINTFIDLAIGQEVEIYVNVDSGTMNMLVDSLTFTAKKE